MSKQTAVEWLAEKYNYVTWMRNRDEISAGTADEWRKRYLDQAKEMEKEQMEDVWHDSRVEDFGDDYIGKQTSFNDYYNETYKTKEK